jgi:hypothetical protein
MRRMDPAMHHGICGPWKNPKKGLIGDLPAMTACVGF